MANTHTEVRDWPSQLEDIPPSGIEGVTIVSCSHPYHGHKQYYLTVENFQNSLMHLLAPFWINGYTITIYPR